MVVSDSELFVDNGHILFKLVTKLRLSLGISDKLRSDVQKEAFDGCQAGRFTVGCINLLGKFKLAVTKHSTSDK